MKRNLIIAHRWPVRRRQVNPWPEAGARTKPALHRHRLNVSRGGAGVMESSISATDDVAVGSLAGRVDIDLKGDPDSLRGRLAELM